MAIATINPATGELIKSFTALTEAQIDDKIAHAAKSFQTYSHTSLSDRARWMNKAADILEAEKESLGHLMTLEMGKTLRSAIDEAAKCATGCRSLFIGVNAIKSSKCLSCQLEIKTIVESPR